jgi:hypothetical protein
VTMDTRNSMQFIHNALLALINVQAPIKGAESLPPW